ncbi:MAG: hypothetical protein COX44_01185 [Candidatus Portnoybacteria bacterium CG23_combo_of_CG06-09_8_20_14_all_37_13]|uniref:Uncharacterized protein n=1 Tax=Candidatus Portnoybacteria bacterium CG23_combo_of_CG06-09_8_20_14_all_37_13 TaxID=1974819 RepID=A0A2G9YD92_9BACT|nr:MAG: hypothetical protein COX44_01185 [Candidatus Portnoybacteria bacterium CG23_combo_of_CG06-09_8_20_14_all_37_13]
MWKLIKLQLRAKRKECWLEVIDLTYILLEIELRLLLTSKGGNQNVPLSRNKIDQQEYLMSLASLAKNKKFLNYSLWKKIVNFNKKRKDTIHGLAQGRISYTKLKDVCENTTELIHDIRNLWLPIIYGEGETLQ